MLLNGVFKIFCVGSDLVHTRDELLDTEYV